MPSTATYGTTGDPYLNGVLSGIKWGVSALKYSFPTSGSYYGATYGSGEHLKGFEAFTAQQQSAVRSILKMYSSVANVTFTEVGETATVHGDLRYAESDSTSTAWAYYPSTNAAGGDAWFNNSKNWYDAPAKGNYGWLTMMHETGHAMGLKHPHEASGAFAAMPTDKDSLEYTVMSYRSYVGASTTSGYTNGTGGYPQTLMMYDIAGLQKLYGANYATNSGNTVYSWSATTGEMLINGVGQGAAVANKILMTVWDGGGTDTYSFANYTTGVAVDLNPGGWTTASTAQLASLGGGKLAIGNIANALLYNGNTASLIENAIGSSAADIILGNAGSNRLTGGAGNDLLDGRSGTDTAAYSGKSADYSWLHNADDSWTLTDLRVGRPDGVDTLKGIELLQFSDAVLQIGTTTTTTVEPPPVVTNAAPIAANDAYATARGTKLSVSASSGVLKNDADPEGGTLKAVLVSGPGKGSLSLKADGSFVYSPVKKFVGSVSFTYKATDGVNSSATATATITVGAAAAKKGHGSDGHGSMEDDQIPGQASSLTGHGQRGHDWQFDAVVQSIVRSHLQAGAGDASSMPDQLDRTLAELWSSPDSGQHSHSDTNGDINLTGLPDFMKMYSSEFVMF